MNSAELIEFVQGLASRPQLGAPRRARPRGALLLRAAAQRRRRRVADLLDGRAGHGLPRPRRLLRRGRRRGGQRARGPARARRAALTRVVGPGEAFSFEASDIHRVQHAGASRRSRCTPTRRRCGGWDLRGPAGRAAAAPLGVVRRRAAAAELRCRSGGLNVNGGWVGVGFERQRRQRGRDWFAGSIAYRLANRADPPNPPPTQPQLTFARSLSAGYSARNASRPSRYASIHSATGLDRFPSGARSPRPPRPATPHRPARHAAEQRGAERGALVDRGALERQLEHGGDDLQPLAPSARRRRRRGRGRAGRRARRSGRASRAARRPRPPAPRARARRGRGAATARRTRRARPGRRGGALAREVGQEGQALDARLPLRRLPVERRGSPRRPSRRAASAARRRR